MHCSTEDKIKQAALQVFVQKGYANCSSREIAREAGMNVALVNYYFRSKSKLFTIIFESVMQEFLHSMVHVFSEERPLREKIRVLIEKEYEFLAKHPDIPLFIQTELSRNPEVISGILPILQKIEATGIFKEAAALQVKGEMIKIDVLHITLIIMSNCQFPFIAKPLLKVIHQVNDETYTLYLKNHKEHAVNMVLNYLFPNESI